MDLRTPPPRAPRLPVSCRRVDPGCCEQTRRLAWRRFCRENRAWLRYAEAKQS